MSFLMDFGTGLKHLLPKRSPFRKQSVAKLKLEKPGQPTILTRVRSVTCNRALARGEIYWEVLNE